MSVFSFKAVLLGAAMAAAQAFAATAADDSPWQACVGPQSTPGERVSACTAVIDGKTETGRRLAAAYCNRGHGQTENRELDRALADLGEAVRLDADGLCAYTNRGRVHAMKRDLVAAIADYDQAIRIEPSYALAYNKRGDAWNGTG